MIVIDPELDLSRAAEALKTPSPRSPRRSAAGQEAKTFRLPSTRTLARFLTEAQAAVRLRGQVTVLLTSDAAMRDLNRRFRGKNKPTDVLSFPSEHLIPGTEKIAGDLAIGVETALRQANEQQHSLAIEIRVLMLHGLLHLAGYDHETDSGRMHLREQRLRKRLRLPLGLIERSLSNQAARPKRRRTAGSASRRGTRKIAPDGVRRGTRRTQSGESRPNSRKPRRGEGSEPASAARSARA